MLKKRDVIDASTVLILITSLLLLFQYINADLPFTIFAGLTIIWGGAIGYMIYRRRLIENRLYRFLEKMGEENEVIDGAYKDECPEQSI